MSAARKLMRLAPVYLAAAVLLVLGGRFSASLPETTPFLIPKIPRTIDAWQGTDRPRKDARAFFRVAGDTVFEPLVRNYRKRGGGRVVVLNALEDLKGFQRGIHDPRYCYESIGWTIEGAEDIRIEVNGEPMPARLLTYTSTRTPGKRMEVFTYFYDGQTITSDLALRLLHFRNRLMTLAQRRGGHLLYLGVSAEMESVRQTDSAEDLRHLMGAILASLTAGSSRCDSPFPGR